MSEENSKQHLRMFYHSYKPWLDKRSPIKNLQFEKLYSKSNKGILMYTSPLNNLRWNETYYMEYRKPKFFDLVDEISGLQRVLEVISETL